ncbi:MAG: 4-hydroxy-3-methylbut-2-enyl diphosphate reductase [bacterium]
MRIVVSPAIGFCYGVKLAIERVLSSSESGKTVTLGPLIHNAQVVEELEKRGIRVAGSLSEVKLEEVLVISAQGARAEILEEALKRGIKILDLTCPELERTRELMLRILDEGYEVLLLGDPGHSEVESLLSFVPKARLVSPGELLNLPLSKKVALFSQSTQDNNALADLAHKLIVQGARELRVFNTICSATRERQGALRKLLPEVEGVVVLGGKNSANTRRLALIAQENGKRTWHVERAEELEAGWFQGIRAVGVVSGASTPKETVEDVVRRLRSF